MDDNRTPYSPERISPPGETILDLLEERRLSKAILAEALGLPASDVTDLLSGALAIDHDLAASLETEFGVPARYWLRHEKMYRLSESRHRREALVAE